VRRARERDEEAVKSWRSERWPEIKKARENGLSIVFIDESGFMLQPVVWRTWAPRGKTPIHYSWDRLSCISAITISPLICRIGLSFQIHKGNVRWKEVIAICGGSSLSLWIGLVPIAWIIFIGLSPIRWKI